jgi:hypothetical protein
MHRVGTPEPVDMSMSDVSDCPPTRPLPIVPSDDDMRSDNDLHSLNDEGSSYIGTESDCSDTPTVDNDMSLSQHRPHIPIAIESDVKLNRQPVSELSDELLIKELMYDRDHPGFAFQTIDKLDRLSSDQLIPGRVHLVGDTGVTIESIATESDLPYGFYKTQGEYVLGLFRSVFPQSVRAYDILARLVRTGVILPSDFRSHRTFARRTDGFPLLRQYVYVCEDGHHIAFHALGDVIERIVQTRRAAFPDVDLRFLFKCPTRPESARELLHGRQARSSPLLTKDIMCLTDGTDVHLGDLLKMDFTGDLEDSDGHVVPFNCNVVRLSSIYRLGTGGDESNYQIMEYGCSVTVYRHPSDCGGPVTDSALLDQKRSRLLKKYRSEGCVQDAPLSVNERVHDDTEFFIETVELLRLLTPVPSGFRLRTYEECIQPDVVLNDDELWCDSFLVRSMYRVRGISDIRLPLYLQIPHPTDLFEFDDALLRRIEINGIAVLRLGLLLYHDDFNVYNKVYHSTGGCYIQITNLDKRLRNALDNWWLLLFAAPGCAVCHIFKTLPHN